MELLFDQVPTKVFEGEGGGYYAWTNTNFPTLGEFKFGAGLLILSPNGFALPHYSDCNKIGFVTKGTSGRAGIINPNSRKHHEKVVKLTKGDTISVPKGSVSWWLNSGNDNNDEFQIIFLGETVETRIPGQFTYSFLTGALGILRGFSTDTITKTFKLDNEQTNKLMNSQPGALIIKLDNEITHAMPLPCNDNDNDNDKIDGEVKESVNVKNGGCFTSFVGKDIELSGNILMLEPNAIFGPLYYAGHSGVQFGFVVKGSGRIEIVGMNGKSVVDANIKVGQLFVVPKYNVVAITAGQEGLECFYVVNTSEPVIGEFSLSCKSIWSTMSSTVVEASFKINFDLAALLLPHPNNKTSPIISSPN